MKALPAGRATLILPLLMLPLVVGSLWLAVFPHHLVPRTAIVAGTVVVAWYVLGGWIAGRQLLSGLALARQVRAASRRLRAEGGCAWLVDPAGTVRAQTAEAEGLRDLAGQNIAALVARCSADPAGTAQRMAVRAAQGRTARLDLPDGSRVTAGLMPGTALQCWRLEQAAPGTARDAAPPPVPSGGASLSDMPFAMLDMDGCGRVRAATRAAEALLGPVPPGILLGELIEGLGRPLADWIDEVREGRSSGRGEVMRTRAEGRERDLQVTLAAEAGSDRIVAVLTDASAIKTLEAQFVQSQKMQAIGQLAGGIAHDFNNLLTAISGHCDLLMVSRDKTDPDYDDLHQISQNANRAAALVRQLLAFSRKQTLKPEIIDLRDTLPQLAHLLNRLVGERIVLTMTNDPALRPIRADARQLEQVLMNLVVNARDAMPGGGEIILRTENLRLGSGQSMEGASLPQGDYVRITVTDEGCGIAPDVIDKIFEPFFTTKRVGEGTGLGLSTAYGIVKQTGGYIFCDSEPGRGTSFSIYFPAQKPGPARQAQPVEVPAADLPGAGEQRCPVVLLVEDEAPVRAFARRALALRGFKVIEAESGEEALECLRDETLAVDIFVTDVIMPGLDGPAWVREALAKRPGTKVIFMSGYADTTFDAENPLVPGALFLAKPFSLSDLVVSVENHLAGRTLISAPRDDRAGKDGTAERDAAPDGTAEGAQESGATAPGLATSRA
ncbi:ATP-binding protein [Paracoccus contaminans]|uniref:histidine kinase n=1 Tax=Paracoccus contaminans TaxID=1945662 RepID=A0A1W6CY73_9RHOB|nr:ATP-binding protein [Paracoccus contaminans]ARJ69811.1 hypothetical protein B0A89_09450 [Paracoccus contaminans]